MKRFSVFILILAVLAMMPLNSFAQDGVIYVATTGSDTLGDGSISAPYATLSKAVTASRSITGKKRIRIRGGQYPVNSTVNLGSRDNNLIIENYPGEYVEFSGGISIPFSAFTKVTDENVLDRIIEQSGKDSVMQVYLPDLGITDYGELMTIGFVWSGGSGYSPMLTYKDKYMDYARYPNDGYLMTETVIRDGSQNIVNNKSEVEVTVSTDRFKLWKNAEDPWALGFLKYDWADYSAEAKFLDESIVTYVAGGSSYGAVPNRRIKFFNLLEELDVPGEYYLNRSTGYLYIIPPEGITKSDEFVFTVNDKNIIYMNGCNGITIQGISFKNTRGMGFYAYNCKNITVDYCEFAAMGDWAINFYSISDSTIKNCYLHDLSSGGILLNGGDRNNLTPANCLVENCKIERFMNYRRTYSPAIMLGTSYYKSVGMKISHCEISDAPHEAIEFRGNDMVIEYTEIYNVCNDTADCGAIYSGRDWTMRGNKIMYNYIHDIKSINTTTGMNVQAVYLDDAFSSAEVYGNIISKCSSVALYGGGRYNTFENNIVLDCKKPFVFDARCTTWLNCGEGSEIMKNLKGVPYNTSEAWTGAYPELAGILDDEPQYPKHNTIMGNVIYNTPDYDINPLVFQYGTVKNNAQLRKSFIKNCFVDYENGDFTLKEDSEIYKLLPDFEAVDFKSIGTYDYKYSNLSTVPKITNPSLNDNIVAGDKLTLNYGYVGDGFPEGDSKITWYIKNGSGFEKLSGENGKEISTNPDDVGLEIYAEIIPKNCEGVSGGIYKSNVISLKRKPVGELIEVDNLRTEVKLTNNSSFDIPILSFIPEYITDSGYRKMTSLEMSRLMLLPGGQQTLSASSKIMCADSLESIK